MVTSEQAKQRNGQRGHAHTQADERKSRKADKQIEKRRNGQAEKKH